MEVRGLSRDSPEAVRSAFLETTGYARSDLLAWNFGTRKFMTRNGGKYQLSDSGKVIHLAGPSPDPEDRL